MLIISLIVRKCLRESVENNAGHYCEVKKAVEDRVGKYVRHVTMSEIISMRLHLGRSCDS